LEVRVILGFLASVRPLEPNSERASSKSFWVICWDSSLRSVISDFTLSR
jgi:hypothetical protein